MSDANATNDETRLGSLLAAIRRGEWTFEGLAGEIERRHADVAALRAELAQVKAERDALYDTMKMLWDLRNSMLRRPPDELEARISRTIAELDALMESPR